ncbi:MAG: host specificity factor TipJ family phage tail protein, partial [Paracoccus sp. (in: a-proteobacteria)]
EEKRRNDYTISGWRNGFTPDGAIPVVLGSLRYAPPFGAMSWSEIEGDRQFIRTLFMFGEGRVDLTDFRIGDTSISEYDDIEMEVRSGVAGQAPCSLYPRQILEEGIGVELTRPLPRDDAGNVIDGEATETPVVRTTGADAKSTSIILGWPGGLVRISEKGDRRDRAVDIRIEQRLAGAEEWQPVETLSIRSSRTDSFYRQHSWDFPQRGRWEIRLTMLTAEDDNPRISAKTMWVALQTLRPEYPLAIDRPMAMVAMRVRATHQLSGNLDNFTARATRICPDWDHETGTWVTRATSNPASLYRLVLQHPSNPKKVGNAGVDLHQLQDWHDFCRLKGLAYNRVLDQTGSSLRDVLTEIAVAGRATPRHDGLKWGVVIDRPSDLVVDHITPRNSWNFSARRSYVERPHGLVVRFQDETNDFKETQRVIPWPGYTGSIDLTEALDLPGITSPDLIFREATRRMHEAELRPDIYEVTQDGAVCVATRGDTIVLGHDVLSNVQKAARVREVRGNLLVLDEEVTMVEGQAYGIRFRRITAADTVGSSDVRYVLPQAGTSNILTLTGTTSATGADIAPEVGDLILFGPAGRESTRVVVTQTEVTEDACTILRCVDASPEIDTLTDLTAIPAWSGRVGAEIPENLTAPPAPRFVSVTTGASGGAFQLDYGLVPGSGPVTTARFEIEHRLQGASGWIGITIAAADGGGLIAGYVKGNMIELRARAISPAGVPGPYGPTVTYQLGSDGEVIPAALDSDSVNVTPLLGGGLIQFAAGTDRSIYSVQLYRSTSATLNRATDAVGDPLTVSVSQSYSFSLGDATRQNLLSSSAWTTGAGWTVSSGVATHAAGTASNLSQPLSTTVGRWYRFGYSVAGRSAGTVTPRLSGGSTVSGASFGSNGIRTGRLQAVSGNNSFDFVATAPFNGSLADMVAYR